MKTGIKQLLIGLAVASALCATSVNAQWYKDENGKNQWRDDVTKPIGKSSGSTDDNAAVARTRRQVLMLDDLYKTAVVAITEHYVHDPSTLSAASAAKVLFGAMKAKGWHDARLLGFTDVLFNASENKPKDDFERVAKEKILAGAASYEAVETQGGKKYSAWQQQSRCHGKMRHVSCQLQRRERHHRSNFLYFTSHQVNH